MYHGNIKWNFGSSQSIKDLSVQITLRDEMKRGGLRALNSAWAPDVGLQTQILQDSNESITSKCKGDNVGRIKLSILVQNVKKNENPLRDGTSATPAHRDDEEDLKIEEEDG